MIEQEWDQRYAESDRIWSGQPNQALVAEVAEVPPGRALDVGCGEGADVVWLARQGWDVTGLEVSGVALQRARQHADEAGVAVRWVHSGLVEAALAPAGFDLVTAFYPALPHADDHAPERALLHAVAPGGTLLFVHHVIDTVQAAHAHPHDDAHEQQAQFDPADYVMPDDVARLLDASWTVEVDEVRPRHLTTGAGAGHSEDRILRARRLL